MGGQAAVESGPGLSASCVDTPAGKALDVLLTPRGLSSDSASPNCPTAPIASSAR